MKNRVRTKRLKCMLSLHANRKFCDDRAQRLILKSNGLLKA